mgnify:CR=1 FL=1
MKITKKLVKQIIQEELEAQLEEQVGSFVAAGEEAARRREKAMQGPSAIEKFISDPSAVEKAAAAAEPKKTEPAKKARKKARRRPNPQTQMMQAMLNLALKGMKSKLPPLKIDGISGRKTRAAAAEVRKNIKKQNVKVGKGSTHAESFMDGLARLAGMSREKLKKIAVAKVVDAELKPAVARINKEIATVDKTASPAGIFTKESFERFLK